tara:strand:- start:10129 stop:10350 length:222 start_codon:yes stop_codon:yes gene_type:complete
METLYTKVIFDMEDGTFTVSEWDQVAGLLQIGYEEDGCDHLPLPVLNKSQWETLKRAGDYVFSEINLAEATTD